MNELAFQRQCRRLSWSYFGYFAVLALLVPYLGFYLDALGFSSRQIGELIAISTICRVIGPPIWAAIADRVGKLVPLIRFGVLSSLVLLVILAQAHGYLAVALLLGLISLFWSAILPQLEVVTLASLGAENHRYSRIRMAGSFGFILVALVTAEILALAGTESFPLLGAVLLLPLLLAVHKLDEPKRAFQDPDAPSPEGFWQRIRRRPFVMFIASTMLLQMSFAPFYAFFALYLTQLGYAPIAVGALISLGVAAEVAMFFIAGRLVVQFTVRRLLLFCLALTSLRWLALANFADTFWWLIPIQLVHAFSFALHHSAAMRFVHRYFPSEQHSRGQAFYVSVGFAGGGALGAWIAGFLWQQGDGAEFTFTLAAIAAFIGFVVAIFIREQTTRVEQTAV
ncbi:MFS transporter [Aliidiomarina iranensis]|uniref:MFS transporter n=1 Tax=Aliidiomarina iranensis TaxID=1434071 RepID=A0A432VX68_9GAMM|nr:MFS transporter [Aliidiomarina iranensis]RUO21257.1 MFS transporter [Aliidiomarina iranensis]